MFRTVEWTDAGVVLIDQRKLPTEEVYPIFRTYREVAQAIKDMVVRGAPAIGVTAAMEWRWESNGCCRCNRV
jgi:methylthioribose-1-phosphate isomerase